MRIKVFLPAFLVFAFAVTIIFAPRSSAQDNTINCVDVNGKRQGYWKIVAGMKKLGAPWNPNQVVQEGKYIDSKPEGVWVSYHQNGNRCGEVAYKAGRRNGPTKYYNENGGIISSGEYVDGKRNGLMTTYYPDGKVWMEYHWSSDEIIGNMKTYYPSGKLYEDGTWANGWFVGDYIIYNEDGSVKRVALPPITQ